MAHEDVDHYGGTYRRLEDVDLESAYRQIVCGHCGTTVGAAVIAEAGRVLWLRCNVCGGGTVLMHEPIYGPHGGTWVQQFPATLPLDEIQHLPPAIERAYREARRCFSVSAYEATEVVCRKMLAYVAVDKGAPTGQNFLQYVEHLEATGLITPPMKDWAGLIRQHGNAAVHELDDVERDRAEATLAFTAQLLRIAYEMPGMASKFLPPPSTV